MAAMAALISSKICFLFIALTVMVVVGSPTKDLLESVDCLLSLDSVRKLGQSDRQNTTHKQREKEKNQSVQVDSQGHVSHYQELMSCVLPVGPP